VNGCDLPDAADSEHRPSKPGGTIVDGVQTYEPDCTEEHGNGNFRDPQPVKEGNAGWSWKAYMPSANTWLAAAMLIVTVVQSYFLYQANCVADRSADAAQNAAIAAEDAVTLAAANATTEQRAYLGVEKARIVKDVKGTLTVQLVIKNFGATPAKAAKVTSVNVFTTAKSDGIAGAASVKPGTPFDLPAGDTTDCPIPLSDFEQRSLRGGDNTLTVTGEIEYVDIFGYNRREPLGFEYVGSFKPANPDMVVASSQR
jgi:hypothetical protein